MCAETRRRRPLILLALLAACNRTPEWTELRSLAAGTGPTYAVEPRYLDYSTRITAAAARVGGLVVLTGQRLVMVSRDGGRTWKTQPGPIYDAKAVLISSDGNRLFVYGQLDFGRYGGDAVFESRDDGATFKQLLSVNEDGLGGEVFDMAVSTDQRTLFVLATGNVLHRSDDEGANWSKIELGGCGSSSGHVAPSPDDRQVAVLGCDSQVYLVNGKTPPRRISLGGRKSPYHVEFSSDGATLELHFSQAIHVGRGKSRVTKTTRDVVEYHLATGASTSRPMPEPPPANFAKPRMCKYSSDPYPVVRVFGKGEDWGFRTDGRLMSRRDPEPTWQETSSRLMACDGPAEPERVIVAFGGSLFAYGDGRHCLGALAESKDHGITWESKYQGGFVSAVARTSDATILIADGPALRLRQAATDAFQEIPLPSDAKGVAGWQLYCRETSEQCWAGGARATILHSADGGKHFGLVQSVADGPEINLIAADREASRLVMAGDATVVYESRDHGLHFAPIDLGEPVTMNAAAVSSDRIWLAVADGTSEGDLLITVAGTKPPYAIAKRKISNGHSTNVSMRDLWQSPDGALWIRTSEDELLRSLDGGENFALVAGARSQVQIDRDARFAAWGSLDQNAVETVSWSPRGGVALLKTKRLPRARGIKFQLTKERAVWVIDVDAGEFEPDQAQLTGAVYLDGATQPIDTKVVRTSPNPLRFELQPSAALPATPKAARVRVTVGLKSEPYYLETFEANAVPLRAQ